MRASKIICALASCLLLTALPSCSLNKNNQDENSSSYRRPVLFKVYAKLPDDKDYIPLYSKADTASGGVTPVYFNDELKVLSESGDWYEVDCKGYVGYIQKKFVSDDELPEDARPVRTKASTTTTTTTTAASTAEEKAEKTTTTAADKDKEKDKDKDKDKDAADTTTAAPETESTETTVSETAPPTTAPLPASAYPDVNISLDIDESSSNPDKYDITLTMDGRFSRYVYELHRIFADGTDTLIASGESGETKLKLATIDSLTETQTIDRLIITTYHNSVAGNKVTLDLNEPTK